MYIVMFDTLVNPYIIYYGRTFLIENLSLAVKIPSLVRDMLVNFGDILPETSKNSTCWDMGGSSNLK